ncbi:MAG: arginase family protein, partial [Gammaproteobacteria bacterium]
MSALQNDNTLSSLPEPQPTTAPGQGFLGWPIVTDPARWDADVALLGIPQSEPYPGDACPNDQSRAPDAIRAQSAQVSDGPSHWDFDNDAPVRDCLPPRCIDIGNVLCRGTDWAAHAAQVEAVARRIREGGALLLAFGGDHGVTIPLLRALEVLGEPVHIVHVDAHLDWREEVRGVRGGYSSPLRRASELPFVRGMTQIGMRGTGSARREEVEAARAWGSRIVTATEVHRHGIDAIIDSLPRDANFFITIDADGLDPACMPGVLAPVPGGLRPEQVFALLKGVAARGRVLGMDVVEIAPSMDFANALSCITAGRLVMNLLG